MNIDHEDSIDVENLDTDVAAFGTQEATGTTPDGVLIALLHWLF